MNRARRPVQFRLRDRQRDRRAGGDGVDQVADGVRQLGRHRGVDQPQPRRLGAAERPGGEGQLLGLVGADALAQQPRGPEVEAEPPLGEDGREPGGVRAPGQIRGQGHAQPGPHAHPVDRGDDRHRAVVHRQHRVPEHAHGVHHRRLRALAPAATTAAGQVGPGAEVAARAGQVHGPGAREGDVPERRPQRDPHVTGAGVLGGRVVERDAHDVALALDQDVGVVGPHRAA
jgi:hypothetical protein